MNRHRAASRHEAGVYGIARAGRSSAGSHSAGRSSGTVPVRQPWSTEPILEMEHVSAFYATADGRAAVEETAGEVRPVIRDVSLTLDEGDILLVVGRTGSGKSTLLSAMTGAMPHTTGGMLRGSVRVVGRDTRDFPPRMMADAIGVVGQNPQASFIADTVEEELAYGMEQLGLAPAVMRKRMEEVLDVLGIGELRRLPLQALSGGQQQRVALGAVLTSRPALIVMDEPTSALDPNGAEDVLSTITRVAHDLGTTVVLAEHRIERVLQYADLVAHVSTDGWVDVGSPADIMALSQVAPPVVELGRWAGWSPLPLSVRDARRESVELRQRLFSSATVPTSVPPTVEPTVQPTGQPAVRPTEQPAGRAKVPSVAQPVDSRAQTPAELSTGPAVQGPGKELLTATKVTVDFPGIRAVDSVSLSLRAGEVVAIMGRNGCGKSTLLWALQGTGKRTAGKVHVCSAGHNAATSSGRNAGRSASRETDNSAGRTVGGTVYGTAEPDTLRPRDPARLSPAARRELVGLVPQNPSDLLYGATVAEELAGIPQARAILDRLAPGIPDGRHPRDLSEGQRLSLALAIQLSAKPGAMLLDEPTRGLDYSAKAELVASIKDLKREGHAVLVATHDVEFAALCADRVIVMGDGKIVAEGPAVDIVASSPAYAPQVAKVTSGLHHPSRWLTVDDVIHACQADGYDG